MISKIKVWILLPPNTDGFRKFLVENFNGSASELVMEEGNVMDATV